MLLFNFISFLSFKHAQFISLSVSETSLVNPSIPFRFIFVKFKYQLNYIISTAFFAMCDLYVIKSLKICSKPVKPQILVSSFERGMCRASAVTSSPFLLFGKHLAWVFLTSVSGLSRTHSPARGVHPHRVLPSPPAVHQHAPKMAPAVLGLDLVLDPDQSPGKRSSSLKLVMTFECKHCLNVVYIVFCQWCNSITHKDLQLCLSTGPVLIEVHAGTTPALVPAPTDAVPGADRAAGSTVAVGVTADPPCQIGADT